MKEELDMEFSENLIKKYLDLKAYEKRGLTREEYIQHCKEQWDKTEYDSKTQRKTIVDFLFPVTFADLLGISESEFDYFESLGKLPINGIKDKTDIECIVVFAGKREHVGDKVEFVNINETIPPTTECDFEEVLTPQLYFVAFFDVLGFSNLVTKIGSQAVLELYQNLINLSVLKKGYKSFEKVKVGFNQYLLGTTYVPVKYAYFSDTILLWTTATDNHASPFTAKCADLMCEALKLGIPLRGSICFGEAIMHKATNTFIGDAIIEAAKLEKSQKWVGASFGESFLNEQIRHELNEELVVPLYLKHLKEDLKSASPYLTLDWITKWQNKGYSNLVERLVELEKKAPQKNKEYYKATIDFIKYTEYYDLKSRGQFIRCNFFRIIDVNKYEFQKFHNHQVVIRTKRGEFKYVKVIHLPSEAFEEQHRASADKVIFFIDSKDKDKLSEFLLSRNNESFSLEEIGKMESQCILKNIYKDEIDYIDYMVYDLSKFKQFEKKI